VTTVTGTPPATTKTIAGLTPGTAYTFTVTATNPTGPGPESSPSSPVTPLAATPPGAPTGVTALPDAKAARVAWTAPSDDGGSAITGYTVTPFDGATALTPTTVSSGTSTLVTGLTAGTSYTFTVKATNGAGTGAASTASAAAVAQSSIFEFATPTTVDGGDASAVNVGLKFAADRDGSISGVRFYKAAANTGTHLGTLWTSTGTVLRQGTFTNESASGWQTVVFSAPVAITAGTTYVVSYLAPGGHYSLTGAAFSAGPVANPPLQALANATTPNGVYAYGSTTVFPQSSYNSTNYWVDVLFN
jgi:hypothetical protein